MEETDTKINETNHDEQQRRKLQEYIFDLEEAQDKTEELSAAHKDLKHSQDLLLSLLRGTIHGICLIRDRKFAWCNEAFEDILGWGQDELIGTSAEIIYPSLEEYERMGKVIYGDPHRVGLITYEYDFLHSDGHRVPCLVTGRALDQNDRAKGYVFSFTDVTEQKRARESLNKAYEELAQRNADLMVANEELNREIRERKRMEGSLQESEEMFRTLVDNSPVGISIIQNERLVYQNPEHERMIGPLPASFNEPVFEYVYPDDLESTRDVARHLISGKKKTVDIVFRFYPYGKKGSEIDLKWVDCRASLIKYKGKKAGLLNMIDVTRARELERLLNIQDKMISLGRMATGIAHEIRNPLSTINVYLSTLRRLCSDVRDLESETIDSVKDIIEEMESASNKIEFVIKRVMDFSRPGKPDLNPVDINQHIGEIVDFSSLTLRNMDIEIETVLAEDLPQVRLDSQAMEQVILNLITNAADAMKAIKGHKRLEIGTSLGKDFAAIRVSDSGPGVPPGVRDKIFDPFFTTREYGAGIGLSICKRIVTDCGGSLDISTSKWGGAEFLIKFPIGKP